MNIAVGMLPAYIEPMLARPGEPFDSDRHLFEIKWDGTRALAFVDGDGHVRMMNRRGRDIAERYPEIVSCLQRLPAGTVLDGEVVVLVDGKPHFESLQRREQKRSEFKIRIAADITPALFVVFDQLYDRGESIMRLPLTDRREHLRKTVARCDPDRVLMSTGIIGDGRAYFREACLRGLEGVVAKRCESLYLPGQRTDSWIKIKRFELVACAIMGYVLEGNDLRSLILVAQDTGGNLTCVGKVGVGLSDATRQALLRSLKQMPRRNPVVATRIKGVWVEPTISCTVRCMERTSSGVLRAPVLETLHAN